jgi:hypothetical protein
MFDIFKAILGPILKPLIDKIPDVNLRKQLEADATSQLLTAMTSAAEGQMRINEKEAQHGSMFVAGSRPFIMWVCGVALAYNFILYPIILWIAFVIPGGEDLAKAPQLDTAALYPLLTGMLGLGTMRSFDKKNGVARSSLGSNNGN